MHVKTWVRYQKKIIIRRKLKWLNPTDLGYKVDGCDLIIVQPLGSGLQSHI